MYEKSWFKDIIVEFLEDFFYPLLSIGLLLILLLGIDKALIIAKEKN